MRRSVMVSGLSVALLLLGILPGTPAAYSDRQSVEICVGGGAWIPTGIEFESDLDAGPAFRAGIQIPMSLGNVLYLHTGYCSAGCSLEGCDGVSTVPLFLGYRIFPLYRRYAGPRAIELFAGLYGGGLLAWDSTEEGANTATGGFLGGVELGARIYAGSSAFVDVDFGFDYSKVGGDVAGTDDLSGLRISAMLCLAP
ncbi:hypothetical protein JW921_09880 [Candidatus Fermentibacterales bacterium]|nr:hypothetical protein [Candidatus Fermentibacterales bacterium]